ncbi:hypothetical protein AWB72_04234 [Caballeronia concitans]|uniref:Uncharacterized protein n=1 Tax=Caballeronia concitans TaxID=1777133 RepID=A0A658R1T1_9BURK|nr:hypothetical protein BurMR1_0289 [Burkholderia sp. MR1]SAL40433.1 hypothetical protein AWB72_04234 [Caballeronia concitans]
MNRFECRFGPATPLLMAALALLAFPLHIDAQTSDVVTRSPSPSASQNSQGGASAAGSRTGTHRAMRDGMASRASSDDSTSNAYIGSDPDLARPLVPCDATGATARVKRGARGRYAPAAPFGSAAGVGYDPATGISAARPSMPSCFSILSASRDATLRGRGGSVDERLAPDANSSRVGGRRPGTLTLLRPFAN